MSAEQLKVCKQRSKPIVDTSRMKFCSNACMTLWHDNRKKTPAHSAKAIPSVPGRVCAFCKSPLAQGAHTLGVYCSELCKSKATKPVRGYCTPQCRSQAVEDGDVKLGGAVTKAKKTTSATSSAPSWPCRFVVAAKKLSSRLRRSLASVLQVAVDKLS